MRNVYITIVHPYTSEDFDIFDGTEIANLVFRFCEPSDEKPLLHLQDIVFDAPNIGKADIDKFLSIIV